MLRATALRACRRDTVMPKRRAPASSTGSADPDASGTIRQPFAETGGGDVNRPTSGAASPTEYEMGRSGGATRTLIANHCREARQSDWPEENAENSGARSKRKRLSQTRRPGAGNLDGEALAALGAASIKDGTTTARAHAFAKTMRALALDNGGLISAFGCHDRPWYCSRLYCRNYCARYRGRSRRKPAAHRPSGTPVKQASTGTAKSLLLDPKSRGRVNLQRPKNPPICPCPGPQGPNIPPLGSTAPADQRDPESVHLLSPKPLISVPTDKNHAQHFSNRLVDNFPADSYNPPFPLHIYQRNDARMPRPSRHPRAIKT